MRTSTTLLVICLVIVGYFLSPPFVAGAYFKLDPKMTKHPTTAHVLSVGYAPAWYLAENFDPYGAYMERLFIAFGVPFSP